MWRWLRQNGTGIEAISAAIMALVAIAALVGVKYQIDATDRIQKAQAAREIYRGYLALSVQNPSLVTHNYCHATNEDGQAAYENYVEYLLYTAEQVIEMDPAWRAPMIDALSDHAPYLCARNDWATYSLPLQSLWNEIESGTCSNVKSCAGSSAE